ncbi:NAD(P)-dependent oxidoreductase [Allosalinactinospora lopnorensis]|uniref:NAD(P)-dependent oxidoreductase n=1 Tax=Allosalinactinospora lopnorensis TaxID=1352348 RepID=UPI00191BE0AA|nr:NAD(P)H-binding protein [Allosalinactinospora lopnorensis]
MKPILRRILRHAFTDMLGMEEVVSRSSLDWTIMRPPQLTDKPPTANYRARTGGNVRGGFQIPRADLAHAVLETVDDKATFRTAVSVAT